MFKKLGLVIVVLSVLFVVAGIAMAQEEAKTETTAPVVTEAAPAAEVPVSAGNKICPVTGENIKELGKDTVEYKGKVYNLCCPMCKEEFLKDPDKYISKVNEELAAEKTEAPAKEEATTAEPQAEPGHMHEGM